MSRRQPSHRGTPIRSFRCSDEIWDGATAEAANRGRTLTGLMVEFLASICSDSVVLPDVVPRHHVAGRMRNGRLSVPLEPWEEELERAAR